MYYAVVSNPKHVRSCYGVPVRSGM